MSDSVSGTFELTETPVKLLSASESDRVVFLSAGGSTVRVGYSSTTLASLFFGERSLMLFLPQDQELWAASIGEPQTLGLLSAPNA